MNGSSENTGANQPNGSYRKDRLVSIVLPSHNEEESIAEIIQDLLHHIGDPVEIIVVDDDSQDSTRDIVKALNDPRIVLIHRKNASGLASAIIRGVVESTGEIVLWIDVDAWMMPPLLPDMIEKLVDHDGVVASRYVDGGGDERTWPRVFASKLINGWAKLCLGGHIQDYTSNFVVVRRSIFDYVIPTPVGFGEFFIELIYRAMRKGASIIEVPYVLRDRKQGASKASANWLRFLKLGIRYFLRIITIRIKGAGE